KDGHGRARPGGARILDRHASRRADRDVDGRGGGVDSRGSISEAMVCACAGVRLCAQAAAAGRRGQSDERVVRPVRETHTGHSDLDLSRQRRSDRARRKLPRDGPIAWTAGRIHRVRAYRPQRVGPGIHADASRAVARGAAKALDGHVCGDIGTSLAAEVSRRLGGEDPLSSSVSRRRLAMAGVTASCPKCGFEEPESATECSRCGIVFGKWTPSPAAKPALSGAEGRHPLPTGEVTQGLGAAELRILGIGLVLAIVITAIPFARFIFHPIIILVHELGHAVAGWLLGYPSIPSFDFVYGGGITPRGPFQIAVGLVVAGAFAYLGYIFRENR